MFFGPGTCDACCRRRRSAALVAVILLSPLLSSGLASSIDSDRLGALTMLRAAPRSAPLAAHSDGPLFLPAAYRDTGSVLPSPSPAPTGATMAPPKPTATATPNPTATREQDQLDRFFSLDRIHTIDLDVGEQGYDALIERPREYVSGSVRIDDATLNAVGVRLKGGAGSFVPLDGDYPPVSGDGNGRPGKSALVMRFDAFTDGQDFAGLEKLTLNNLVQDASSVHEFLGYALFREGGIPASRVGYAQVTLNGRIMGLYAVVESPDDPAFLRRWFSDAGGNLYEGEYGVDLRQEDVERFEQDRGRDRTRDDLRELAAALDGIEAPDQVLEVLEAQLDLDAYLAFAATELYLAHWDGYAWGANNYRIYRDPGTQRWSFIPWGIDQVFAEDLGPYSGVMRELGPSWGPEGAPGRVHALCMADPACSRRIHDAFEAVLERSRRLDLVALADDAFALVGDDTRDEASEFGDPVLAVEAQERVYRFLGRRAGEIQSWLPCLAGQSVDHDLDGYDGCRVDCDDRHPAVHPGAAERCNFRDDDCNAVVDDPAECPRCIPTEAPDGRTYGLCFDSLTWSAARERCVADLGDLASLHDRETADLLAHTFAERLRVGSSWIGLNDREAEGTFVWTDRSPVDFEHWAPNGQGEGEDADASDCVAARPYGWRAVRCHDEMPYVCRIPAED